VKRLSPADADERLSKAAGALLSRHDEGNRFEARLFDLVHALQRRGLVDGKLILSALEAGEMAMLAEMLGRMCGISFDSAWEHFVGGPGGLALLLRLSGVERDWAGEIVAAVAEVTGTRPETEMAAFDELPEKDVESARNWLRLDPAYRSAISALGRFDGQPSF
jgi:hypothetical protein